MHNLLSLYVSSLESVSKWLFALATAVRLSNFNFFPLIKISFLIFLPVTFVAQKSMLDKNSQVQKKILQNVK